MRFCWCMTRQSRGRSCPLRAHENREQGEKIRDEDVGRAKDEKAVYRQWLEEKVFCASEGSLDAIMVFPVRGDSPLYRDDYRKRVRTFCYYQVRRC